MTNALLVAVDVGSRCHEVVVGDATGVRLDQFSVRHEPRGFDEFFRRVTRHKNTADTSVSIAMEGYNGWARPLDQLVLERGWRLFNVNNLKLARYKEIFPSPAKTDAIDSQRMLELFAFQGQEHVARDVLQEVPAPNRVHQHLKYLTRRRRQLVEERALRKTRLQADLQAFVPGLLQITGSVGNLWFLRLLTCRHDIRQLARLRPSTLKKIPGVGARYADLIRSWQKAACFSPAIELAGPDLVVDARAILALSADIRSLEKRIEQVQPSSTEVRNLLSLPGFGIISVAELIGEMGSCERFRNESSLAYYIGMAPLDHSSGKRHQSRRATHINRACQRAMMIATVRHMSQVPQSRAFYDKKRLDGKSHNQAVRALGRHLTRVIWKMLTEHRDYVQPGVLPSDRENKT